MRRDKDCPYKKYCGEWDNCGDCDYHEAFEALRNKIAYHKRRADRMAAAIAEKENPTPLTLKELRNMDGEPVWVRVSNNWRESGVSEGWCIVRFHTSDDRIRVYIWDTRHGARFFAQQDLGISWWAYRHKPKEETPC